MESILKIVSVFAQILASLVTFGSGTIWEGSVEGRDTERAARYSLGHKEFVPWLKWVLLVAFVVYVIASVVLLCMTDLPEGYLWIHLTTFVIMLVVLVVLSVRGRNSLKTRAVLAPKKFW